MKPLGEFVDDTSALSREECLSRRDAEWRRLVEEAQADAKHWQEQVEMLSAVGTGVLTEQSAELEAAEADAKKHALVNVALRAEVDRLKRELAEARAQARDEALREAADTVHAGALAADKEAGCALASLCLSLAEHAIRALRKP